MDLPSGIAQESFHRAYLPRFKAQTNFHCSRKDPHWYCIGHIAMALFAPGLAGLTQE
jgi:hypothetical protein